MPLLVKVTLEDFFIYIAFSIVFSLQITLITRKFNEKSMSNIIVFEIIIIIKCEIICSSYYNITSIYFSIVNISSHETILLLLLNTILEPTL